MSTVADLVLVTTDSRTGRSAIGSFAADAVLGGAILVDLVETGRLRLEGEGRHTKVAVIDERPSDDPVLEAAFAQIRGKRHRNPQTAVTKLGKHARNRTYEHLTAIGAVRATPSRVLGIFPVTRYGIVQSAHRKDLLARISGSLLHHRPVDPQTGPLISLLAAADLLKVAVDKQDLKRAKTRAKHIAAEDWAGESVRKAIEASQAVLVATVVGTAAAASS